MGKAAVNETSLARGRQEQFLDVLTRDEAERRWRAALELQPLGEEQVPLDAAAGRLLARDISAPVDVPAFDRSNMDGFAVRAADTFGATEQRPRRLRVNPETILPGRPPELEMQPGTASVIATGAMLPRGADAVVMVEDTELDGEEVLIRRSVSPGTAVSFAGSDIGRGELVLYRGTRITSRETGLLAALGVSVVPVFRRPRVAVISTGDELVRPGQRLERGKIYDSNMTILADAVRELGGEPVPMGIVPDDELQLQRRIQQALDCDLVLLSGGTSKGAGDLSYRVVSRLGPPGVLAHGVALKPGKPICLAACRPAKDRRVVPVVILPGFPTSAIFTFHEFVAPVIRLLAGDRPDPAQTREARVPVRVNSERGRTEYLLVSLVHSPAGLAAYPMGKGSGSVTAFSRADGFVIIDRLRELLPEGSRATVHLIGRGIEPADLVALGSHCIGLDLLLALLNGRGWRVKSMAVGSSAGLAAVRRGECDLAGIHLLDPVTGQYNLPFIEPGMALVRGYRRMQGIVFRPSDERFVGKNLQAALAAALADQNCYMVNRNRGSGTRVLVDRLLSEAGCQLVGPGQRDRPQSGSDAPARSDLPPGYWVEVKSHNAVVAAVLQGRADWGVAIEPVARDAGLGFIPVGEERFDFLVPTERVDRPALRAFRQLLKDSQTQRALADKGLVPDGQTGELLS